MALEFYKNFTAIISYYKILTKEVDQSAICSLYFIFAAFYLYYFSTFLVVILSLQFNVAESEFCSQKQSTTVLSGMAMSPPPYITSVSYVIGFPQNIPESVTSRNQQILSENYEMNFVLRY